MNDRKRFYITLSESKVEATRANLRALGLHPSHLSKMLDEYLDLIDPMLREMVASKASGKQLTMFDILATIDSSGRSIYDKD
jgi:hypothetical protein